jgi:hypothetical protein
MASQADNERQRISALIAKELSSDTPQPTAAMAATEATAAAAAVDPKELFCKNWDTVKAVLGILRKFAPAFLKPLIDLVIKGGDALKKAIC